MLVQTRIYSQINVKNNAFGNNEHTTDWKMGVLVLLRSVISSNDVCNTAYALYKNLNFMMTWCISLEKLEENLNFLIIPINFSYLINERCITLV